MEKITVSTHRLLTTLKMNRDTHLDVFKRAMVKYREKVIEELDRAIKDAKGGGKIRTTFQILQPINQVHDYDVAIDMLKMHTEETLPLSETEFRQYVKDEWNWSRQFTASNMSYLAHNTE